MQVRKKVSVLYSPVPAQRVSSPPLQVHHKRAITKTKRRIKRRKQPVGVVVDTSRAVGVKVHTNQPVAILRQPVGRPGEQIGQ